MATEFERIKKAVENEKTKKVSAEARQAALNEEKKRVLLSSSEAIGFEIKDMEHLETVTAKLREEIETDITKMKKLLEEEGVEW